MVATDAHVNIETDVCTQRTLHTNAVYRQTKHLNAIQQCACYCAYVAGTVAVQRCALTILMN